MTAKFFPSLISVSTVAATALVSLSAPAQAFTFGTSGISFTENTTVNFTFNQSHGAFTSSLGIYQVNNSTASLVTTLFSETKASDNRGVDDWKGTLGNTVLGPGTVSFTFLANQVYTLGLRSLYNGNYVNTVFSTSALNGGSQQFIFGPAPLSFSTNSTAAFANPQNYQSGDIFSNTPVQIGIDDRGNRNDVDYNDFSVTAQAVPEPFTMGGMAIGAAWMTIARRRRRNA